MGVVKRTMASAGWLHQAGQAMQVAAQHAMVPCCWRVRGSDLGGGTRFACFWSRAVADVPHRLAGMPTPHLRPGMGGAS